MKYDPECRICNRFRNRATQHDNAAALLEYSDKSHYHRSIQLLRNAALEQRIEVSIHYSLDHEEFIPTSKAMGFI